VWMLTTGRRGDEEAMRAMLEWVRALLLFPIP